VQELAPILAEVREFKPHLIHSHYMVMAYLAGQVAEASGLPFTLRSHSFDIIETRANRHLPEWQRIREYVQRDNCLGVLGFPFLRAELLQFGVPAAKLIDAPPVVAFERFHDRGPNGEAIMNMGAVRPKKRMRDFVDLSAMLPGREFNLYAIGYNVDQLREYSVGRNAPVNFIAPVPHRRMPAEYKRHQWLVYTANAETKSVGWPMAVAEAQAAGVGVCLADIRPDLKDYVGTAGYLYKDLETVRDLIAGPVPAAMREAGFEQARRSDIRDHIHKLTDLWGACLDA
jgi:glycosyltransferase involved in cell wall biosynthesis